jgi:hypothetical protein
MVPWVRKGDRPQTFHRYYHLYALGVQNTSFKRHEPFWGLRSPTSYPSRTRILAHDPRASLEDMERHINSHLLVPPKFLQTKEKIATNTEFSFVVSVTNCIAPVGGIS